ncbi:MAG: hypothetical protein WD534_13885 [Phycisphaeraceae bacterium]
MKPDSAVGTVRPNPVLDIKGLRRQSRSHEERAHQILEPAADGVSLSPPSNMGGATCKKVHRRLLKHVHRQAA